MKTICCVVLLAFLSLAGYSQQSFLNSGMIASVARILDQTKGSKEFSLAPKLPDYLKSEIRVTPKNVIESKVKASDISMQSLSMKSMYLKISSMAFTRDMDKQDSKANPLKLNLKRPISDILK